MQTEIVRYQFTFQPIPRHNISQKELYVVTKRIENGLFLTEVPESPEHSRDFHDDYV